MLVFLGAALWFFATVLLHTIGPMGALRGLGVPVLYALVIPGTVPFILIGRKLARLPRDRTLLGVGIMTGTASLLDGMVLAWFPSIYGTDVVGAATAILWGVGVGLLLGVVMNKPDRA
ncbi:MAG: hypothetical protein H0X27_07405 [Caulobacteraceae bacterium]|nr:hypothetical protein [Caulobacteraceae bacterium]